MANETNTSSTKWPILGIWTVDGQQETHPGILYTEGERAYLKLFLAIEDSEKSFLQGTIEDHPHLIPFRPPNRFTVLGETKRSGRVTLLDCAQTSNSGTLHLQSAKSYIELTLLVSQAWTGNVFVDYTTKCKELSFAATGLHNVLATSRVEMEWLARSTPERHSETHDLHVLTGANQAFLVFRNEEPSAEIEASGKKYKITFSTLVQECRSSTMGVSFGTEDSISVETEAGATIPELMAVSYQLEQFLSLLCIGPFRGEGIKIALDPSKKVELVWSLGREPRNETLTRMPHQILVGIGQHPGLAVSALKAWFGANDARRLARWLIFDSLFKETSSTAKFLAVAQAWEIIGRENVHATPYEKQQFQKACGAARHALEASLGAEAATRLSHLLQSSNQKAFADLVRGVISKIPALAVQVLCSDVNDFVTALVDARNVLTHMQGRKNLPIEKASYLSLFLTYKLIVLFCIYECAAIGLPLDNLPTMLTNNEMARAAAHGLPDY
ncbi:MAG: HEPN domain-containing protein [Candidatus Binatus sp.]|uniref:ApeA N-terminal domain 1-containing protein n=1 Tax=Candidatus Binatus sp. TaxID=2811406 RepID=UPI003C75A87E